MSRVQRVRRSEHSLVALLSQDADVTVEALSNLPPDARGRLQTILTLSEEVAAQTANGLMVVVDTSLGRPPTTSWSQARSQSPQTIGADSTTPQNLWHSRSSHVQPGQTS